MRKKVGIIGLGILGTVVADTLNKDNLEVHIFDTEQNLTSPKYFKDPEGHNSLVHKFSMPIGSPGNLMAYGLAMTNTINSPSTWPQDFISNIPKYTQRARHFGFPKIKLQLHEGKTFLKINYANRERFSEILSSLKRDERIYRHEVLVDRLEMQDDKVVVYFCSQDNVSSEMIFDEVLICAGPVKSFELINRSGLIPMEPAIIYFDHPTMYLGRIKTSKHKILHRVLRNSDTIFGSRPGAIVLDTKQDFRITVRMLPIFSYTNENKSDLNIFLSRIINRIFAIFGFALCREFAVTIAFDFQKGNLKAITDEIGKISSFNFDSASPNLSKETITMVEEYIVQRFGQFRKSRESSEKESSFSPAAHFSGFLGSESFHRPDTHGFHLNNYPSVWVPGAASFPESVSGHPTYLGVLTALYICD